MLKPVPVRVTPGAASKLAKGPSGADSKVRIFTAPAAASKADAAKFENGCGSVEPAPLSAPVNVANAAWAELTRPRSARTIAERTRVGDFMELFLGLGMIFRRTASPGIWEPEVTAKRAPK